MKVAFKTEQNRTEQNRTEQNRTEQNRTEQNRTSLRQDVEAVRSDGDGMFSFLLKRVNVILKLWIGMVQI